MHTHTSSFEIIILLLRVQSLPSHISELVIPLTETEGDSRSHVVARNRRRCRLTVIGRNLHIFTVDSKSIDPARLVSGSLQRRRKAEPATRHRIVLPIVTFITRHHTL